MRRFRFSLETLLRHRKGQEDRERTTLSQLRANLQREEIHRQELEQVREDTRNEVREEINGELDPVYLNLAVRYLDRLGAEIGESVKRIESLHGRVRTQTEVVVEASRRTKVLDTLKGKRLKQYRSEAEKVEQKMVDEIVVTRFAHKES